MQPTQVVQTAVSAVANRITHTGTATTTSLTDSTVDRLYGVIARRLTATVIGARVLRDLETQPTATATATRTATEQAVAAEADADQHFADELRHLVDQLAFTPPQSHPSQHPTAAPRPRRIHPGAIAAIAAVAVLILAVTATILTTVVLPRAGLTEGARLDRLAGIWTSDEPGTASLIARPDGTFTVVSGAVTCLGRVTSPARSEYVLEMECQSFRTSLDGTLDRSGNTLTLTAPGVPETTLLNRM